MEMLNPIYFFVHSPHKKAIMQFGSGFVIKIIESPVRLRIDFPKANSMVNLLQPRLMLRRYSQGIKGY